MVVFFAIHGQVPSLTTAGDMDGENKTLVLPNLEELEIYASVLLLL